MLWLSIYLSNFALEVFGETETPFAVRTGPDNRPVVHVCNGAAEEHGIHPGQPLEAAFALCHTLLTRERDRAAEHQALNALALWSQQFTPLVHIRPHEGLMLEVAGSRKLFGGLAALRDGVAEGLQEMGYRAHLTVAPTPLGGWLLAKNGVELLIEERDRLRDILQRLPLSGLEVKPETIAALRGMGLRRVGDVLRQPRGALARRVGPDFYDYLDRAIGLRADPRRPFEPPSHFDGRLPLPAEVDNTDALLFAARRLVLELVGLLRAKGAGVQDMRLTLEHRGRPESELPIGLRRPSRDADHLLTLIRERLERFELPASTDAIGLHADRFPERESEHDDLFSGEQTGIPDASAWLEKLRARLGDNAVGGLGPAADHRPEKAWRPCPPGHDDNTGCIPNAPLPTTKPLRPLWLFPEPKPLEQRNGRPRLKGELHLIRGPERIETGWWDGDDAARDYFIAADVHGEHFWIYRERRSQGWFLQGVFA
ncbi:Y-family DNA polymerase [Thiohalomonas denitrificans]|uniref:Y-family DNA polymerase n=1 Tax=Thiohalomonas denitrificans TaxID=415747 RepID=UPI0026EDA4FB|nr:DNA polymerase Y family protein [Thiohalomonas denitrificans]